MTQEDLNIRANALVLCKQLIGDYIQNFISVSPTYAQAIREDWDIDLWRYVHAVADVQAQMIVGEKRVGWDGVAIFGARATITDEMLKAFLGSQRRQANIGIIEVAIPTSCMQDWKAYAKWKSSHNQRQHNGHN